MFAIIPNQVERKLEVGLFGPTATYVFLPKGPDGVKVSGLSSRPANGPVVDGVLYFTVTVIVPGVAINLFSNWLYERIKNYRADRITINGKEPKDRADFDRIVGEEIQI